jgi:hypothetical protein
MTLSSFPQALIPVFRAEIGSAAFLVWVGQALNEWLLQVV